MDFAERVLRNASSGRNLGESFADFVRAATKALGVKAFILPLDDVDTSFERGWLVLETLRKYLATPRLITILSGDLNLYQMLVLRHNYDQLQPLINAEKNLANQDERTNALQRYKDQAQNLRDQYLTKILPPHRRIHLRWLRDQLSAARSPAPVRIDLAWTDESSGEPVRDVPLEKIIGYLSRDLFGWPHPLSESHSDGGGTGVTPLMSPERNPAMRILPSNTRNFLRLLKALCPWHAHYRGSTSDEGAQEINLDGLFQTFAQALYEVALKIDDLNALANGKNRDWLANLLWEESIEQPNAFFLTGKHFREWEELEQAFLLVQGAFYRGCRKARDLSALIDYGIRVVTPALVVSRPDDHDERKAQVGTLVYRMQLGSEIPTVDVAGHLRAATWMWQRPRNAGYMRVLNRRRKDNLHSAIFDFAKSQDKELSKDFGVYRWWNALSERQIAPTREQDILPTMESFWHRSDKVGGQILALYFMTLRTDYGYEFSFIDLYQGLGNLAGLLHEVGRASEPIKVSVQRFLERRSNEVRSYPISPADITERQDGAERDEEDVAEEEDVRPYERSEELERSLSLWAQAAMDLADKDRPPSSPPLYLPAPQIGSVFEQLEKQMESILAKVGESGWSVGAMLERWTTAFWQNLLLIELEHRLGAEFGAAGLSLRSVVKTTAEFEKNIEVLERRIREWQPAVLRWRVPRNALLWMSCPVLMACCHKDLRQKIMNIVALVAEKLGSHGEQSHWAQYLHESMEACRAIFTRCQWRFVDNNVRSQPKFDIHELWCSLFVAPGSSARPTQADYEAFRKETGLTLRRPTQSAKNQKNS